MEWSNPGPPWRRTRVGFSRMTGPSGTRPEPSTSKTRPTPLTSPRIARSGVLLGPEHTPGDVAPAAPARPAPPPPDESLGERRRLCDTLHVLEATPRVRTAVS